MIDNFATILLGLFAWTLLEYLIHGWLGHTFTTVATKLHLVHHHDPHAIFTIGAWLPITALWTIGLLLFGSNSWMIFFAGVTAGFIAYEAIHYRIHFSRPKGSIERWLREHHLLHHQRVPDRCFGVTSPLWDVIFGTEPARSAHLLPSVRETPPLTGRTNARRLLSFHYFNADSIRAHENR